MVDLEKLKEIGLSDSEIKIYTALLRLGEATVVEISKDSGLHRTNIYDSLEQLKEKGLVSFLYKENKQYFRAISPDRLLDYLKEREESITKIIPDLKNLQSKVPEKITVEIFKGKQGLKSTLKEILAKKEEVIGYSVAGQLREYLPEFAEYYFREQEKNRIFHRFIYTAGVMKPSKYYIARYLPKEYVGTTISICCSDIILNIIWEPEIVTIKIKSKQLVEDYKKHFRLLWKIAKEKNI